MLNFGSLGAAAALLTVIGLGAAQANAASLATFVSGKGTDSGDCSSPASPCRTFQFAVNQTLPSGVVKALDPADYQTVTINKSISLTGVEGAGINSGAIQQAAIVITLTPNISVNLTDLIIDGQYFAGHGINGVYVSPGAVTPASLTMTHCTIRNFYSGIYITANGLNFLIAGTVVTNNFSSGIYVNDAKGTLDRVLADLNNQGIQVNGALADVTAVDTTASNNTDNGFFASSGAVLRLAHSTATKNNRGVYNPGSTVITFGDNHIAGNTTDFAGPQPTKVGTQ